jgi:hypothetical protein
MAAESREAEGSGGEEGSRREGAAGEGSGLGYGARVKKLRAPRQ